MASTFADHFFQTTLLSRRSLLTLAAGSALLAACGGDDDDDDDAPADGEGADATATPTEAGGAMGSPEAEETEEDIAETEPAMEAEETEPEEEEDEAGDEGEPRQGGVLRMGFEGDQVLSLDPPIVNFGTIAGELLPALFSSLVQFDETLAIQPDLAETFEVSDDGLSYTFHLREGLTFHNGDPLLAEDIIYTYDRTLSPELASPHANKLEVISSIEAVDDLTVEITLSQPFAPFLAVACSRGPGRALTPVSRRAVEEMGDDQYGLTPVGCGPFMIVPESVDVGEGFEMVAFEDWYGGRPHLDRIVVSLIPEPSSRVAALEAGDIDFMSDLPTTHYDQIAGNNDFTVVGAPGTNWVSLVINHARPPWDNVDARMAVAKAIDKDAFNETAFLGLAVPSTSAIAPAFGWVYLPPEQVETPQAYNLDEAKQLVEQTGIAGTTIKLMVAADNTRPGEVIRNMLADIDLNVELEPLQDAAWSERWLAGDYDMMFNGSNTDADPDDGHWNFFHSTGPWNTHGLNNPEIDRLLEETRATVDQDARREQFLEIARISQEEVSFAFLYHAPDYLAYRNNVKGYVAIPEQRYFEHVWLEG